jgi:Flp pilus assembly protein TadD
LLQNHAAFRVCAVARRLLPKSHGAGLIALHGRETNRYSGRESAMILRIAACAAALFLSASPAVADARSDAKEQVAFGIAVAQRGLWREAIYRWERAIEIDPTYASAFNDLAIGYEHEGQLDKAREAYEKALELEPDNVQIRQNFELFKEINDRTSSAQASRSQ